jgi:hypothetical protein
MDARFYNSEDIDIERLANDLVSAYQIQGYQAQQIGNKDQVLVQLKKGGDFEAIIGMQAALSLTIQRTTGGVLAMVGQQRWLDKAAVGAVGIVALPVLWPLALTAGVGALRQASLGNQVLNMVDGLVRQQRPGIQAGPIPYQVMPQLQQQQLPPPAYSPPPTYVPPSQVVSPPPRPQPAPAPVTPPAAQKELRCTHCNTPYEQGDTFCTGCGRSLTPPRLYCSNCNSEVKQGAAFCPKCGASTFTTVSAAQTMQQRPAPVTPTPRVTYTPAPTPPPTPTPVYTPPLRPQTPVYTPSNVEPYAAPTVPAPQPPPAPPKQPEVYYVPPATQEPAVQPQPTVSYMQQTPKQETPPPPKQPEVYYVPPTTQEPTVQPQPTVNYVQSTPTPKQDTTPTPPQPRQEKVYYTPSQANLAQSTSPAQPVKPKVQTPAQQPPAARPIASRPASKPATDPAAVWGTLTFSDGTEVQLKGESVSVGRYDHDLGGIQPDIDLAKMEGADTVSRIHAAIEHIGSTYTLTDLNSTNSTRLNNKRLEPDKATPINDDDTLSFGKVTCTFKKL